MPYVPTPVEVARLRSAIEVARFREGERVLWLTSFLSLAAMDIVLLLRASWVGLAGSLFGFLILYWRLRGGHLRGSGLFGLSLRTREQRAFTGLMLRHAFTGRNPLAADPEHDPFERWHEPVGEPVPEEPAEV